MIGNITFYNPQNRDMDLTISEIFGDERESVVKKLKEMDRAHGYIPNKSCHANSYDNDDYLFVADMLQDVRELHKKYILIPKNKNGLEVIEKFRIFILTLLRKVHLNMTKTGAVCQTIRV